MKLVDKPNRFDQHRNAFGFLRLFFASLVIVSHVPEIVDNDSHREILHRITGVLTFGNFAVWGFFVISGYLITASMLTSGSFPSYLNKRIARIYPGFIFASVICLLIVTPLAGGSFDKGIVHSTLASLFRIGILARPTANHLFDGQNYNDADTGLNGAMWTIQYEFFCYIFIACLGIFGLARRIPIIFLTLVLLIAGTWMPLGPLTWLSHPLLFPGPPQALFQMSGMFLSGACWYLYRDKVEYNPARLSLAVLGLAVCLLHYNTAAFGYATFGGYLIFGVAKLGAKTWLADINNKSDISYGVYLYAWPAEQLLIRYMGTASLLLLALGTWVIAVGCGWISWVLIEKPALKLARRNVHGSASPPALEQRDPPVEQATKPG